jgi:hypothetical protein
MPSGAGHDAQDMTHIAPTGMIFVPSAGGISHSPKEFTSPEDIANGVDVLRTVLAIDRASWIRYRDEALRRTMSHATTGHQRRKRRWCCGFPLRIWRSLLIRLLRINVQERRRASRRWPVWA